MTERLLGYAREVNPLVEALRQTFFWWHLIADFLAGLCFVVGSVFFFYESLMYAGTWLFLIGSLLFVAKPTIRLIHDIRRRRLIDRIDAEGQGSAN